MACNRLFHLCSAGALAGGLMLAAFNANPATQDQEPPAAQQGGGMPDLVGGLVATKGCLGVETAQTASGKQCIFAWFENKAAVGRWYYGEVHQGAMDMLTPDMEADHKPMAMIADDEGPILVIASITPSTEQAFEEVKMPISQIAIELYKPLPGGAHLGGRFAPATVKVQGLTDYTPPAEGDDG